MKQFLTSCLFIVLLQTPMHSNAHDIDNSLLTTIGSSGAISVYNTYQLLDLVMEAYQVGTIDQDRARLQAQTQVNLMQIGSTQHRNILQTNVLPSPSDKKAVQQIAEACEILEDMADALLDYTLAGGEDRLEVYEEARGLAWEKVKELLGLP